MEPSPQLAQLIHERKERIVEDWSRRAHARPVALRLSEPYLTNSIPGLIDHLADAVATGQGHVELVEQEATEHAGQRMCFGYSLGELVDEYIDLRQAFQEGLADVASQIPAAAWNALDNVVDDAVKQAIDRFSRAREHKLHVLERVSSEPLAAGNVDELLAYLLGAMAEVAPEVDTVTILLREGDALHVRASRGLEEETRRGFTVAIGDGFAGTIAATRQPLLLHDAAHDPTVKSDVIRDRGLEALYGVPLVDATGDVIGVAHMGSTQASEFQEEDLLLFQGLCNRMTALIASRRQTDRLLAERHQGERFVSVVGHDLRSPLAAILASAHLLLRSDPTNDRVRRTAARIARVCERMAGLLDDLLDFTRVRAGKTLSLNVEWVDLGEVANLVLEDLRSTFPDREVRLANEVRARVCCDGPRIARVLSHLVGNALRHGAQDAPVDVTLRESGEDVVVTVHNQGPAIPPTLMPHLFEPFQRSADDRVPGVGLGLFIANTVVVAHGGSIEARSEAARGTTFVARMPKERGAAGETCG